MILMYIKVSAYDEEKQAQLKENKGIIRNQRKISAAVSNATIFMKIQEEYGTFSEYLWKFTDHKIIHETGKTSSELSDQISKDLKKRGIEICRDNDHLFLSAGSWCDRVP